MSQQEKFTPGPWDINGYNLGQVIKVKPGPDKQGRSYVDGRHQEVIANTIDNDMTWGEQHANARLISAAPDLFKAAAIADQLIKLIEKWADAEQEKSYAIMDDIVALAQNERLPEKALAKAVQS